MAACVINYEDYGANAYGHWGDDGWYGASMEQDWVAYAVHTFFSNEIP